MSGLATLLFLSAATVVSSFNLGNTQLGANAASAAKLYTGSNAAAASSKLYTGVKSEFDNFLPSNPALDKYELRFLQKIFPFN